MTRKITRTLSQVVGFLVIVCTIVLLLDSRYRVLPDSIHTALPLHHDGFVITDITVKTCSSLNPLSACRIKSDSWHPIEKDLYLGTGWVSAAYLHVQRKKEEELQATDKVVVDVRVGRLDPGSGESGHQDERWSHRPAGLWILKSSKSHVSDSNRALTGVDVLYGADAAEPRLGWTIAQTPLLLDTAEYLVRVSFRRGRSKQATEVAAPRIRADGKFKILQVSDLHLSTGTGVCRDTIDAKGDQVKGQCEADVRALDFVESMIIDEKPDMIVLSGDQLEGPAVPDAQSTLYKLADLFVKHSIPYAAIFGNHDDQSPSLSRTAQMSLLNTLPFSLSKPGPEHIEGIGNYYVEVLAAGQSQHSALTLYFLDTHEMSHESSGGYDHVKPAQIEWFRNTATGLQTSHSKYSRIHLDMAFIHIPLPEYALKTNVLAGGDWRERPMAPNYNSHFYDALDEHNILAVGCGHDHVNDYCALRPEKSKAGSHGPWLCYAGAAGFGGYGGYGGYHRRLRVWEIDTNSARIMTWTRLECCGKDTHEKHNELMIADGGKTLPPATT